MEQRNHISALDSLESLRVLHQKSDFPEHNHDTFCISLIEEGMEAIRMGERTLFTEKGQISINNPYEVHANPIIEEGKGSSFTTLYLSPDLVESVLGQKGINFQHQQVASDSLNSAFQTVAHHLEHQNLSELETGLADLLSGFTRQSQASKDTMSLPNPRWAELILMIDHHIHQKMTLEVLARFMDMDKFNFSKAFRSRFGLSPMNYVLMKKVFEAKRLITSDTNLTQLAYQLDFADQAHFSKQFKRFIGLTPSQYRKQL